MRAESLIVGLLLPALFAAGAGTFRVESALALVNVSVLDSRDRPVTSLSQEHFRVLDNGREQPIRFFAHEDAPVSLAIILDSSGSMEAKWDRARNMLARFCENLGSRDELLLVTVQRRARLRVDYTNDCGAMQNQLATAQPNGLTALLDAIPLAVERLRHAGNPRRAILIVSDGGENQPCPPGGCPPAGAGGETLRYMPPLDFRPNVPARSLPVQNRACAIGRIQTILRRGQVQPAVVAGVHLIECAPRAVLRIIVARSTVRIQRQSGLPARGPYVPAKTVHPSDSRMRSPDQGPHSFANSTA
jgi:hypothetical protein